MMGTYRQSIHYKKELLILDSILQGGEAPLILTIWAGPIKGTAERASEERSLLIQPDSRKICRFYCWLTTFLKK